MDQVIVSILDKDDPKQFKQNLPSPSLSRVPIANNFTGIQSHIEVNVYNANVTGVPRHLGVGFVFKVTDPLENITKYYWQVSYHSTTQLFMHESHMY